MIVRIDEQAPGLAGAGEMDLEDAIAGNRIDVRVRIEAVDAMILRVRAAD